MMRWWFLTWLWSPEAPIRTDGGSLSFPKHELFGKFHFTPPPPPPHSCRVLKMPEDNRWWRSNSSWWLVMDDVEWGEKLRIPDMWRQCWPWVSSFIQYPLGFILLARKLKKNYLRKKKKSQHVVFYSPSAMIRSKLTTTKFRILPNLKCKGPQKIENHATFKCSTPPATLISPVSLLLQYQKMEGHTA